MTPARIVEILENWLADNWQQTLVNSERSDLENRLRLAEALEKGDNNGKT